MFKFLFLFFLSLFLLSCSQLESENFDRSLTSEFSMSCETVISSFSVVIYRCENSESVCYSNVNSLSCFRK